MPASKLTCSTPARVWRQAWCPGRPLQPLTQHHGPARRRSRAQAKGDDSNEGVNVDWDAAWRTFNKQMRTQVDTQPYTSSPSFTRPAPPPRSSAEQLRRQERVLLELWTAEDSLKWGGIALMAGLLVIVLSAGAPVDDRCTLPWC